MGITLEIFQISGNIPSSKDLFIKIHKGFETDKETMEGYRAHNSNTHYALCLIPFTGYGCVLCFITKCLSVVCILRSTK